MYSFHFIIISIETGVKLLASGPWSAGSAASRPHAYSEHVVGIRVPQSHMVMAQITQGTDWETLFPH